MIDTLSDDIEKDLFSFPLQRSLLGACIVEAKSLIHESPAGL